MRHLAVGALAVVTALAGAATAAVLAARTLGGLAVGALAVVTALASAATVAVLAARTLGGLAVGALAVVTALAVAATAAVLAARWLGATLARRSRGLWPTTTLTDICLVPKRLRRLR